ncbi:MAG: OmpH family outer membrane protein [Candidatus Zapsychrus exili]|nr:OmpH family outer membrane protein [Candidatus Zapsychrus exili]
MKFVKIIVIVLLFVLIASASYAADKGNKIGYVDLSRLFDEYHKTKDFDKMLEEKHNKFTESRNVKIEKIREAQGKLALLKEGEKAKVEENIEKMKAELLEYDRQEKANLTQERNEKIREILLEIEKIVSDFAKKDKYSVILNDRVLIYGDQSFNLTENILKILNK